MRDLKKSDSNRIVVVDPQSEGENIVLFYTNPTASMFVQYRQKTAVWKKGTFAGINHSVPAEFALKIITGFGEGSFGFDGQPFSSNPSSPVYRADWKELLHEMAFDILEYLGNRIFGGVREAAIPDSVEEAGEVADGQPVPLARS